MKTFKQFSEERGPCWKGYKKVKGKADYEDDSCEKVEEVAANSVAGGGVDMNPTGNTMAFTKRDKRKKYDTEQMFRRAQGKYKK